jgi:hypothetical protein
MFSMNESNDEKKSIMAQLFILSYSDAVSFRDIRGHLGTIPSIVTFYICVCRRRRLKQGHPSEYRGIKIEPTCRMITQKKRNAQKKEKPKGERTSVARPLSWNIYVKKQCRHTNSAGYNNVCELID